MRRKTIVLLFYCFIVLLPALNQSKHGLGLIASPVWAQSGKGEEGGDIVINIQEKLNQWKVYALQKPGPIITNLVHIFIVIAVILLLFYLVLGGIQWLTSGGDKAAVAAAREKLTAALIGLIIVLAAFAIFVLLRWLFNIPLTLPGGEMGGAAGGGPGEAQVSWVDCCGRPDIYGQNGFTVPIGECQAARTDPAGRKCLADGQIFRWYQKEAKACDQFYINANCWQEYQTQ